MLYSWVQWVGTIADDGNTRPPGRVITATVAGSGETRDEVQDDSPIEQCRLAAHFRMFRGDLS